MATELQKASYINDTKDLIKDAINSKGGSVTTEDTFRSYADAITNLPRGAVVERISVSGRFQAIQIVGKTVSTSGLTFTAYYSNGTSQEVNPTRISPTHWRLLPQGTQTCSFYYEEGGVEVGVVASATVYDYATSLTVSGDWAEDIYIGDLVNTSGLSFIAHMASGRELTVTPNSFTPTSWSTAGIQDCTFTYKSIVGLETVYTTVTAVKSANVKDYDNALVKATAANLGASVSRSAATTVGDYALFGGGKTSLSQTTTVTAYNTSLTKTTASALGTARYDLAAGTVGDYALFSGGYGGVNNYAVVDTYDSQLTKGLASNLSETTRQLAATAIGDYVLFAGGYAGSSYRSSVNAYNMSLTQVAADSLSLARYGLTATTVGSYALFAGGYTKSGITAIVDLYDTSLTRTSSISLSTARYYLTATTVGDYALFGGGKASNNISGPLKTVDSYNTSLTQIPVPQLHVARYALAATTIDNYALFGGGEHLNSSGDELYNSDVDIYDASLTWSFAVPFSSSKSFLAATTVGDYALFGGGSAKATIDVYTTA